MVGKASQACCKSIVLSDLGVGLWMVRAQLMGELPGGAVDVWLPHAITGAYLQLRTS